MAQCCDKIRVASDGRTKQYAKGALGIYQRIVNDPLGGLSYKQIGSSSTDNEYYLVGSREDGWKVTIRNRVRIEVKFFIINKV